MDGRILALHHVSGQHDVVLCASVVQDFPAAPHRRRIVSISDVAVPMSVRLDDLEMHALRLRVAQALHGALVQRLQQVNVPFRDALQVPTQSGRSKAAALPEGFTGLMLIAAIFAIIEREYPY